MSRGWCGPVAAVLLDLDGTLVDSAAAVARCWRRWAAEEGVDSARLIPLQGRPAGAIVAALLPPARHRAAVERIVALEVADVADVRALPGAARLLEALPPGRRAIVTSCTRPLLARRLEAAGLAPLELMICADDVRAGKPNPEPYLLAVDRLALAPEQCLAVEDSATGLAAARAAGCRTLAVGGGGERRLGADRWAAGLGAVEWRVDGAGIHWRVADPAPAG